MKKLILFSIITLLLVACGTTTVEVTKEVLIKETVEVAKFITEIVKETEIIKETVLVTEIVMETVIVEVEVLVTPTYTHTPLYTATITNTPTMTLTPTNTVPPTTTLDPLKKDKGAGFYLVGVDIAPGVWRSNGTADDCYWSVTKKNGDIIDNHFGMAGGTIYISPTAFQVELLEECGTWTWLSD